MRRSGRGLRRGHCRAGGISRAARPGDGAGGSFADVLRPGGDGSGGLDPAVADRKPDAVVPAGQRHGESAERAGGGAGRGRT